MCPCVGIRVTNCCLAESIIALVSVTMATVAHVFKWWRECVGVGRGSELGPALRTCSVRPGVGDWGAVGDILARGRCMGVHACSFRVYNYGRIWLVSVVMVIARRVSKCVTSSSSARTTSVRHLVIRVMVCVRGWSHSPSYPMCRSMLSLCSHCGGGMSLWGHKGHRTLWTREVSAHP